MRLIEDLWKIKLQTKENKPLIHCITNPISINQCANIVLSTGSKPIMAEHPMEVEAITLSSDALCVNLGNITDARIESIYKSGTTAYENNIPHIIDVVGVGCSQLRLDFAKKYIKDTKPTIIKGNNSEILSLLNLPSNARGVDVGDEDKINDETIYESVNLAKSLSLKTRSVVMISGKYDIITDGYKAFIVLNGTSMLSDITGTGCMLNTLIGSFLPIASGVYASLLGVLLLTISSQLCKDYKGNMSFLMELMDNVYSLDFNCFKSLANFKEVNNEF